MRKAAVIIIFVFTVGLLSSSCAHKACPAYSQSDTEQLENQG